MLPLNTFKDGPKTKTAWWAMRLGLATLLVFPFLGIFASFVRPMIDKATSETLGAAIGFGAGAFGIVLSISAIIAGIRAYRAGERSWALWLGFIPAILIGCFWILMIVGEFVFPH